MYIYINVIYLSNLREPLLRPGDKNPGILMLSEWYIEVTIVLREVRMFTGLHKLYEMKTAQDTGGKFTFCYPVTTVTVRAQ